MKIFASVVAFATMIALAPAYTFDWGSGVGLAGRIQFGSGNYIAAAGDTANVANAAVYLVYLGENATIDITADGTSDEVVQTGTVTTAGLVGRGGGTYAKDLGTAFEDGSLMTAGSSTFSAYITYTVDGVTYYNFSTSTYTVPAGVEDNTPISGIQNFTFNWDMDETGGDTPTAGGGWWTTPIPEPMTVLCGLAGLALLLKRRA